MEKPMGLNAGEVSRIADKAAARKAFVAVAFPQRYSPFVARARRMLAEGRFGTLSHLYFRLNRPTSAALPGWELSVDARPRAGGRRLPPQPGLSRPGSLSPPHRRGGHGDGGAAQRARPRQRVEDFASVLLRSKSGVLGTIEIGNTVPYAGSDSEWKIAGRDAMLVHYHDDTDAAHHRGGRGDAVREAGRGIVSDGGP